MDLELLGHWLAARDHVSIRAAWKALPVVRRTVAPLPRKLTLHGAAQLAGAMLGERADWLVERSQGTRLHVHGLAWGQRFLFQLADRYHYLAMRFSGADLDRSEARIAALGSLQ